MINLNIKYRNYIQDTYDELDKLYSVDEWRKKYIVLFGFNTPAEIEIKYFENHDICISAIVDNSQGKHGLSYHNNQIISPEDALENYREDTIIIIASGAYESMRKQIISMGYSDDNIYRLKSFYIDVNDNMQLETGHTYESMELRDIQKEAFEMLKVIAEYCENNNIRYFLSDGTLLGAIRHGGFIPWDDDVDISMPMPDYIRFCNEFKHETYQIVSMYGDDAYENVCNSQIARVVNVNTVTGVFNYPIYTTQGICVDVFPLNGYPYDEIERENYESQLFSMSDRWQRIVRNRMASEEYSIEEHKEIWEEVQKLMNMYPYDESEYIGCVSCMRFNHSIASKEAYEDYRLQKFEGMKFRVPIMAEKVLASAYGDYMKLPPMEKRTPKHFVNTYRIKE